MGAHTPRITLQSVAVITKTELLHEVLSGNLHKSLARIVAPRSLTPKYWRVWRNLRSHSRKHTKKTTKKARNIIATKKVTATPTHPEVLGRVVPGKMKIVVRKLKLAAS